jgi:hypothetical protein
MPLLSTIGTIWKKTNKQKEIDRILEKIHRRGMKSLTPKEKQMLEDYSK